MVVLNDRLDKDNISIEVFREALIQAIAADAINCRKSATFLDNVGVDVGD